MYKKARRGEKNIELKQRSVQIFELELKEIKFPLVTFKVKCSKGTYIRSLANDIGQKLNCGAYLHQLTRLSIGKYNIDNALNIKDIRNSL